MSCSLFRRFPSDDYILLGSFLYCYVAFIGAWQTGSSLTTVLWSSRKWLKLKKKLVKMIIFVVNLLLSHFDLTNFQLRCDLTAEFSSFVLKNSGTWYLLSLFSTRLEVFQYFEKHSVWPFLCACKLKRPSTARAPLRPQEGNGALLLDDCSILRCGSGGRTAEKLLSFLLLAYSLTTPPTVVTTKTFCFLSNFRWQWRLPCHLLWYSRRAEEPLHLHRVLICKYLCIQCQPNKCSVTQLESNKLA